METFQILSDQFSHFQHLFHGWLAIFCIISSYIFDLSSSPHTWGIRGRILSIVFYRFIPTYVGHTPLCTWRRSLKMVHPHIRGAYMGRPAKIYVKNGSSPPTWGIQSSTLPHCPGISVHPHIRGAYWTISGTYPRRLGSSPHTWGIHWTAVRKMAGFSHFSYDFIRKSYFVQGLVFFGVIGAEASLSHRRGRNQCLPGAHGGSVRNL